MLNYPLINTTSSTSESFPTSSVAVKKDQANPASSIPLIGEIAGSLVNLFDIDFDCIHAAFPPKKAEKETNSFIQRLLNSSGYNSAIISGNVSSIEISANKVLKILDYMTYWREKTGDGRSGCTRDGEYLASRISAEYANQLLSSLNTSFTVTISNHNASYTSGFNGAPSRNTAYRQLKLKARKKVLPVNLPPSNVDGNFAPSKVASPNTSNDSYPLTFDVFAWILLILGLIVGLPVLIYQLFVKNKNKKKTKKK